MNIIRKLRASIRLNEAVVKADKAHEETGERYYVMPNGKSVNSSLWIDSTSAN